MDNHDLNKIIIDNNYYTDFLCYIGKEYFQYYIINIESDVDRVKEYLIDFIKEYLNYDILCDFDKDNFDKDTYYLCIDHSEMGWNMILTNYQLDDLNQNYVFETYEELDKFLKKDLKEEKEIINDKKQNQTIPVYKVNSKNEKHDLIEKIKLRLLYKNYHKNVNEKEISIKKVLL